MAYKQKSSIGSLCNSKGPMNMGNVLANPGDTGVQKNSSPAEKSLVGNQKNLPAHVVKAISDAPGKMTGSPLHAKEDIGKPGYDKYGAELISTKQARLKREKTGSATATSSSSDSLYGRGGRSRSKSNGSVNGGKSVKPPATTSAGPAPTVKRKKVKAVKEIETKGVTKKGMGKTTGGGMTGTKVKVSQEIKTQDKDKTNKGIKEVAAKQASAPKEMSRKQIREAKQKDKASGMSRKEVRANKLKRKASSARAKTTSKETAAKGGKEAQRLSRKTIRLEKKVAKQEGRVKASKM